MASILIIDDDNLMCDTMVRLVRRLGHDTLCAQTLKEGLSLVAGHNPDVVFLDVRMPDGNGDRFAPFSRHAVLNVLILRRFSAIQTSFHSALTRSRPRRLNCRNPNTFLIQPLGGSAIHFRFR